MTGHARAEAEAAHASDCPTTEQLLDLNFEIPLEELERPFWERLPAAIQTIDIYECAGIEPDEDAWDDDRHYELDMALLAVEVVIDDQDEWNEEADAGLFCLDCGKAVSQPHNDDHEPHFRCRECNTRRLGLTHGPERWSTKSDRPPKQGPRPPYKEQCIHGHPYTPENTGWQKLKGRLCRYCKTCHSERDRRRYQAKKAVKQ
jgi:hypothetical protein